MKWLWVPLLALCPASCAPETKERTERSGCPTLRSFDPARAAGDAAEAVRRGDRTLLGVYGITTIVPEAEGSNLPVRMVEGTSDAPENERCERLNEQARKYAANYNRRVLGK